MHPAPLLAVLLAVLALSAGLAACGSDDSSTGDTSPSGAEVGNADPDAVSVIDGWSKALSKGDIDAASDFFAIPSTAENGPLLIKISDAGRAKIFNESLPCGAVLTEAVTDGDFTTATFKLTERPGGDCGDGAGNLAQTSFEIKDGKITQWRRVGDQPPPSQGSGQVA